MKQCKACGLNFKRGTILIQDEGQQVEICPRCRHTEIIEHNIDPFEHCLVKHNATFADFVIRCICCGKEFHDSVHSDDSHEENCPWRYYFVCTHCLYQNNLAKLKLEGDASNYPLLVQRNNHLACACNFSA